MQTAVAALAGGGMVVVVDDEDRENEGDLVVAAELCTTEQMAFVMRLATGIVCAPMPAGRVLTSAPAGEFRRPGDVFPLIGREGGVLVGAGHTEAAVDLITMAGLPGVGAIVDEDGSMRSGTSLTALAVEHDLPVLAIADLVRHRWATEQLVELVGSAQMPTEFGEFGALAYRNTPPVHSRSYGVGAQILGDLGATRIRLITNNPATYGGLEGYGLTITGRVHLPTTETAHNVRYLRTKRERMGHQINTATAPAGGLSTVVDLPVAGT